MEKNEITQEIEKIKTELETTSKHISEQTTPEFKAMFAHRVIYLCEMLKCYETLLRNL